MVSFNLPLQPSDFHLQHVSLSKNISLHTISNLILLSHLSDFFFDHQIPWESGHFHVPFTILFPNFFQSERACSIQLNHPIQSPKKPQISSGITQFNYYIIWYGSCPICLSVFPSFDILDFAWHFLPVFSSHFFSPFHFLFFVIAPSYIDVGIPMFYSHPQAVSWLCSWGISNSPMISTKQTEQLFLHISGLKHHCSRCWCAFQIAKHLHPGPSPAS